MNFQHFPCLSNCDINYPASVPALRAIEAFQKGTFGEYSQSHFVTCEATYTGQAGARCAPWPRWGQACWPDTPAQPPRPPGPGWSEWRWPGGCHQQNSANRDQRWHTTQWGLTHLGLGVGQLLAIFPPWHSVIGSGSPHLLFVIISDYWQLWLFISAWPRTLAAGTRPPPGEHPCGESGLRSAALK